MLEEAQKRTLLSNTLASLARAGVPAGGFRVVHEEEKKEERAYVMGRGEEKGVCYVNANERVEAMASVLEQQWRVKREASPKVMVKRKNRLVVLKEKEEKEKRDREKEERERERREGEEGEGRERTKGEGGEGEKGKRGEREGEKG